MPEIIRAQNLDASESAFFARQLEHIKAKTYDIVYPNMKATELMPVSTEAGAGAAVITYQSFDSVGMMKIIANYADDLPRSDIKGKEFSTAVRSLGGSYGYNLQEIRSASMAGLPLQQRKANAVRLANDQAVNKLAWLARSNDGVNGGLTGLIFNPNIPSATVAAGAGPVYLWSAKTNEEIYTDLVNGVKDIISLTKGVELPDTVLMPIAQYEIISSKRMASGTDTTILEFFKKNHPYIKTVTWVPELAAVSPLPSTGVGGPTDLLIFGNFTADKITLEIPQPFEQLPVQERGLEYVVPCHSRVGGVIVYYPLAFSIYQGI